MGWSEEVVEKITTVILDIDGVLTDGKLIYGPDCTMKMFDAQDGHAIKMALREGYRVGVLSGRDDPVNRRRIEELGMSFAYTGEKRKLDAFNRLLAEQGLEADECMYIGDDSVDIPVMRAAALGVAVKNATEEVQSAADVISSREGGDGAVREIIVRLMKAQNTWNRAMVRYMPELADSDS